MIKKMFAVTAVVAALGLGTALPASAATSQTTFNGQSAQGHDVRYFAIGQPDGTGTGAFFYAGDTLSIQCNGYNRYVATQTQNPKPNGYPKSIVNSNNCFASDTRYYAHIESIDRIGIGFGVRGAQGPKDSICITVKLYPARDNPDPVIKDCGVPQGGDVVITPI